MVKNLPVIQETQVQSLGREDPLDKGMATHSSILAWRIPCTEESGATVPGVTKSWIRLSDSHCGPFHQVGGVCVWSPTPDSWRPHGL